MARNGKGDELALAWRKHGGPIPPVDIKGKKGDVETWQGQTTRRR